MNTLQSVLVLACFSFSITAIAQPTDLKGNIQFSFQKISGQTWGVYVLPDQSISPSNRTTTGSGQVTLVAPVDFTYSNLKNWGGTWVENARVDGPIEAYDKAYVSFGFVTDNPKLNLFPNGKSLLFTIDIPVEHEGHISLFENGNDPFSVPNSFESNPGNDIGIIDYGVKGGIQFYSYSNNSISENQAPAIFAKNEKQGKKKKAKAIFTSGHSGKYTSPDKPK